MSLHSMLVILPTQITTWRKVGVIAAFSLLAISPTHFANATPVTYVFTSTATSGPLNGSSSTGTFTFDSSSIPAVLPGSNSATGLLISLNFTWHGITYNSTTANTGTLSFDSAGNVSSFGSLFGTQCGAGTCSVVGPNENWYVQIGGGISGKAGFVYSLPGGAVGNGTTVLTGPGIPTYVFNSIDYPGASFTDVRSINNNGQLVGYAQIGSGPFFSFIYSGGSFSPLPSPPAGLTVIGLAINDSGVVVGSAVPTASNSPNQGFILSGGTYNVFSEPGWTNTEARGINSAGLVTGWSWNTTNAVGFIYNPATQTFTDIAVPGAPVILAQGINTSGQVVGSSYAGFDLSGNPVTPTGFLYDPPPGGVGTGTITPFDVAGVPTQARGINDLGLIAGGVGGGIGKAFVGNSAGFKLFDVPGAVNGSGASAINNAGQVVGSWIDAANTFHSFIATPASLPTGTTVGGAYTFNISVVPNVAFFIDPAVSLGFDYEIGTGDPKFASVQLPIGIGDNHYTLIVHGQAFSLAGGELFGFAAHGFPNGVSQFRVVDIEASAGLDPNNAATFPTGLTFTTAGAFTGTMTPLCSSKPARANGRGRGLTPCLSQ